MPLQTPAGASTLPAQLPWRLRCRSNLCVRLKAYSMTSSRWTGCRATLNLKFRDSLKRAPNSQGQRAEDRGTRSDGKRLKLHGTHPDHYRSRFGGRRLAMAMAVAAWPGTVAGGYPY